MATNLNTSVNNIITYFFNEIYLGHKFDIVNFKIEKFEDNSSICLIILLIKLEGFIPYVIILNWFLRVNIINPLLPISSLRKVPFEKIL